MAHATPGIVCSSAIAASKGTGKATMGMVLSDGRKPFTALAFSTDSQRATGLPSDIDMVSPDFLNRKKKDNGYYVP